MLLVKAKQGGGPATGRPFSFGKRADVALPVAHGEDSVTRVEVYREAKALFVPGARMVDEAECALSVALAILFAHLIGAHNISWAAFSGFVVMRGRADESLVRGILRLIGTAIGAGLALLLVPSLAAVPPLAALVAGLVATGSLYGAMTGKRSYAWLLFGLTFEMILLDTLEHPALVAADFARTRMLEVTAGTVACVLVSFASAVTVRRIWPAAPTPPTERVGWHRHAFRHAAQAGVAVALLPLLGQIVRIPELAQSSITVMASMLVPVSSIGASGFVPVSRRLVQRVAGCLAGAAMAALFLFAAHGSAAVLIGGTLLGVIVGRHVENGKSSIAYVGTQFVLAILVTLVPDDYGSAAIGPALNRLTGILVGMALLEPVLLAWHLIAPSAPAKPAAAAGSSGTE